MPISKEELGVFNNLSEFDKGWLIGIIEGEGCIRYSKKKRSPAIAIEMCDKDTIERVKGLMYTTNKIQYRKPKKDGWTESWVYEIAGKKASLWMLDIFPYMSQRRKQRIQEIILDYGGVK